MLELADIFRLYGSQYLDRYSDSMLPSHLKAFHCILNCRTEALGGHVYRCKACGQDQYEYHSCHHSACPKCDRDRRERWIEKRRDELLPVRYFHVIFTVPGLIATLTRSHQYLMFDILFKSAVESLQALADDPRFVGGRLGILAVLHTWSQLLTFHPHLHCLVPAGGKTYFGSRWLPSHPEFLVPVKALSMKFRQSFQKRLKQTELYDNVPSKTWSDKWGTFSKVAGDGQQDVLDYLGRYVYRVAITNSRLVRIDDGNVTFRYKNRNKNTWEHKTIPGLEFIHRFLQHVLPERFIKIRYYGIWHPSNRECLDEIRSYLGDPPVHSAPDTPQNNASSVSALNTSPYPRWRVCRYCGSDQVFWISVIVPVRCRSP